MDADNNTENTEEKNEDASEAGKAPSKSDSSSAKSDASSASSKKSGRHAKVQESVSEHEDLFTHASESAGKPSAPPIPGLNIKRVEVKEEVEEAPKEKEAAPVQEDTSNDPPIFALRTTANREEQVMDFLVSNAARKKIHVYSVIRPHGMRGYIFVEAESRIEAERAVTGIPYSRGLLPKTVEYKEMEHLLEQVKTEVNIMKNDIAEIISGPFKREKCKITRVDKVKEEVVVELLEAAVPIPITVKMDAVRVIRRDDTKGDAQ